MTSIARQVFNRWALMAVALAAVLAAVLAMQPVGAQSTGECEKLGGELSCEYVEHSTGPVNDFHAATSGAEIAWTLVTTGAGGTSHPDFGDFKIDQQSGVLSFKSPPNYESPADDGTDNTYKVMVKLEVDTDAGRTTSEQGVTVTVTNKEEDGSVSLNNLQPQERELITAELSDPDGSVVPSTWQWSSSSSRSSGYTDIAGATTAEYRPVAEDTGMYLRVTATYTDGYGAEVDTAKTESAEPVRAETGVDNADPEFGEDDDLNTAGRTTTREIDENTPAGTNIGPPVAATDDDLDVLTYSLSEGGADRAKFAIDAANGQLMTKANLDFEAAGGSANNCTVQNACVVEVTVKDPLGNRVDDPALDTITVTITVNHLNEAPTVSGPVLLIRHAEGGTNLVLDSDPTTDGVQETQFTATDPDDGHVTAIVWELSGPDAGKFMIGPNATVDAGATSEPLQFKSAPNFESPGDANKDNVYEVTVVARDPRLATGSRDVTIRVTNVEEGGGVSLSHIQPEVATSLTATHFDPDGGIKGLKWQWMRTTAGDDTTAATCDPAAADTDYEKITGRTSATYTPAPGDVGKCLRVTATYDDAVTNKDDPEEAGDQSEPTVVRATSANPVRAAVSPNDRPKFYKDGVDLTADANLIASNETRAYTRYIRENRGPGTQVSLSMADALTSPTDDAGVTVTDADVTATDTAESTTEPITPDDENSLQYELGGASQGYFTLTPAGLIAATQTVTIQTTKMLDLEDKSRHTVTVKATDPSGGTATVTVTIIVVGVDEPPKIDNAGPMHVIYMENGAAPVAEYMAADPEGNAITWTVLGNAGAPDTFDAEDLKVTALAGPRTMLAFKSKPNYEDPKGGTDTDSNIYTVTLRAAVNDAEEGTSPGGTTIEAEEMDTVQVMVAVTDVPEAPTFSDESKTLTVDEHVKGNPLHRNVGSPVTAKDSDGDIHLTYSLSGADAGYFTIVPATGQIKTMKRLDYETKTSFSVVVTATDPTGLKDTISVTIEVDDVAEAPSIVPGGLSISGAAELAYNENGADAVATYTAVGVSAADAKWTLEGADAGDFSLSASSGATTMLRFKRSPNYEAPADANTDNDYTVTLKATVGDESDTHEVTVTVIDVEEDVDVEPRDPLLQKFDTDKSDNIDRHEVIDAIRGFFAKPRTATRDEVIGVIRLYLSTIGN